MSRSLSIIPIVHSEADLGQLAGRLREQVGEQAWADKQRAVTEVWSQIQDWARGIDATDLHIYQDGLPADDATPGGAERIVRDLANQGSVNHTILEALLDAGAILVGTEDPTLLLREYEIAKAAADAIANGRHPDPRDQQRSATLLERRDRFIADRIDATLPGSGRGVLFIGMLHDVASKLADDIQPIHPLGRPKPERRSA